MAAKGLAPLVLVAAAAGAAGGWLAASSLDRAPLPPGGGESRLIVDELRRLGAELRTLAARPAVAPSTSPTSERSDAGPALAETPPETTEQRLLSAIEQLVIRVEQIASRQIADDGTLQRLAARGTTDPHALDELRRHIDADWDTAQRELFLMPMAVVLQRYGPPTRVDLQSSGMQWGYEFTLDERSKWLGITFHDGVVVKVD